jgi:hypothetical protein
VVECDLVRRSGNRAAEPLEARGRSDREATAMAGEMAGIAVPVIGKI